MNPNQKYGLKDKTAVLNLRGRGHHNLTKGYFTHLTANLLLIGNWGVYSQIRTGANNGMRNNYNYTVSNYRFSMYNKQIGIFISSAFMPDISTSSLGTNSSTVLINRLSYLKINFEH